jgi:glucuronate isomerase
MKLRFKEELSYEIVEDFCNTWKLREGRNWFEWRNILHIKGYGMTNISSRRSVKKIWSKITQIFNRDGNSRSEGGFLSLSLIVSR